jgi:TolB-like protein/cytochrome c-type biogenesis protein CcmH/NrfG
MGAESMQTADHGSARPPAELIRKQLERLLADARFVRSERLSRFLRYTVEKTLAGESDDLKEYTIAVEVYGKSETYDPSVNSLVRVEVGRLRNKLLEYYTTTGRDDPVRIEFVRGKYTPVFTPQLPRDDQVNAQPQIEELKQPAEVPEQSRTAAVSRFGGVWFVVAALTIALLAWLVARVTDRDRSRTANLSSIAILPFTSFSLDPEVESFAAVLMEEVTNAVAQTGTWRVLPRSAMLKFQNQPDDAASAGRQLDAEVVLEGSIRKEGDHLRITAHLVDTAGGFHLWAQTFDRDSREKQELQTEVSASIAQAAAAAQRALSIVAQQPATDGVTEARELYRRARAGLDKLQGDHLLAREPDGEGRAPLAIIMQAVADIERAIVLDPKYAPAYGALAEAYQAGADFDDGLWVKARDAANRGLRITDNLPEAHFVLGYQKFLREWDFGGASREFKRTLELNPRNVTACRLYADCSALVGDVDAGFAALRQAQRSAPDSPVIAMQTGIMLYHARRFDELASYGVSLKQQRPNLPLAHWLLGLALEQLHKYEDAATAFETTLRLSPRDVRAIPALGHVYGVMGRRQDALRLIETTRDRAMKGRLGPTAVAVIYLGLGDKDAAFSWFEKAWELREGALPYIKLDPRCDPIRSDPRFALLLRKMRL